jgi:hypothetical protein
MKLTGVAITALGLFASGGLLAQGGASNATEMLRDGQRTFRYDTFGDEAFWGDTIKLHQAVEGSSYGGVGPGESPKTALTVGLKVDVDALPETLIRSLKKGQVNLDDPGTTLALLKLNAVVGVTGVFDPSGTTLRTIGIQCALCHSTGGLRSDANGLRRRCDLTLGLLAGRFAFDTISS